MAEALFHPHVAPFRFEADTDDVAVLLHGWTGTPAHFRPLGRTLQEAGVTAIAPLLAGHGTTVAAMQATTWRDWLGSASAAAHSVGDGKRLHLVGLSMGGLLALLMAPTFSAATITTINAPMRVFDRTARFSWLMRGSSRTRERLAEPPPDPDVAEFYQQYDRSPMGTAADLFDLARAARSALWRVECPALIIQSRADSTVRPVSAEIIHREISSARKRLLWLESARHMSLADPERRVIGDALVAHIAAAAR